MLGISPEEITGTVRLIIPRSLCQANFRTSAAATMYQRARRFATLTQGVFDDYTWLAQLQLEAYAVSINALSLIEAKSAWFILPITVVPTHEVRVNDN